MSNSNRDINAELLEAVKNGEIDKVRSLISEGAKVNVKDQDKKTPLHWAVENGHKEVVEVLLNNGANVNAEDTDGKTPYDLATDEEIKTLLQNTAKLLEAAEKDNIEEVTRLISEGANVHAQDGFGNAPLHWAAEKGHKGVVEVLLNNGANVNAVEDHNNTPLHYVAGYGYKEVVQALLDNRANVNAVNKDGKTPLHFAAAHGRKEVVEALLQVEGIDVNAQNKYDSTPLHFAAEMGHAGIVKDLLDKGADVNIKDKNEKTPLNLAKAEEIKTLLENAGKTDNASPVLQNDEEESQVPQNAALLEAAKSGDINEVKRLISEGANVNAVKDLYTPLYWAAKNNHFNIVEVLLDNGAYVDGVNYSMERDVLTLLQEKEAEYCKSSLHLAARLGNLEAVKDLLGKGANVNAQNDTRETPLHVAAKKGHKDVVEALLNVNGINVNAQDKYDSTPLHRAAKEVHKDVVEALLDKGANVDAEDENGDTPFDLTTNQDIQTLLQNTDELLEAAKSGNINEVNRLISEGASVNATDQNGNTPLHWAAKNGHEEVVESLLGKEGIDVNAQDRDNNTPLHWAAVKGHKEVLEALLEKDEIDVNAQDKDNRTPLHWATGRDNVEVVNVLIIKGADVNAQDKDNRTPLHFAAQNNNKEIVDALIKAGADVNIKDEDGKTPLDLTTNEEIKTLLQPAEESDDGSVDESSTDSEGGPEEEKRVGDDTELQSDNSKEGEKTSTTSAEQGIGVQDTDVGPVASTEPAQTEEQPSSFFGNLFSILMKPFSLVASFFGGFFSWLFGFNEEKIDESTSQTDARCEGESSSCDYDVTKDE
ncbi:ankyrin repeat domain-containing protein [Wolbachia endosymbiont (group A) of Gymnosoma rotundatum]|uniref:ankyrin repeat domain-containing protein n=1 Tax=Wolbachia endosymbiont (group A) of Gymnosoma rotundatum TaxID=2954016 RepID=UPI0022275F93|nr:ankyrin repeat domain-containing protein [Wolbachia endosymbiont (group A) of Gymnosoma rotundatum]